MKDTTRKILSAATQVWNENPAAPLKDIAETAGVSRMTLHRHFDGREALLEAILQAFMQRIMSVYDDIEAMQLPVMTRMEQLLRRTLNVVEAHTFLLDVFEQSGHPQACRDQIEHWEQRFSVLFEELATDGWVKPGMTAEWAHALVEGVIKASHRMKHKPGALGMPLSDAVWQAYRSAVFVESPLS
ncbi:TetR/AcrR family transcriptional regulator [Hydrogenovibrio halophilus]|uniref:TetR/AcrR family transcriptional regulator n=1 Tax=Hydrogenovibrio halophilus TaxID=373391 RepID=UPI00037237E2|nr:TetR/AcrR family transcriptional regulator [Hydrogenovibrio halophilus]